MIIMSLTERLQSWNEIIIINLSNARHSMSSETIEKLHNGSHLKRDGDAGSFWVHTSRFYWLMKFMCWPPKETSAQKSARRKHFYIQNKVKKKKYNKTILWNLPIMRSETVRCSRPVALSAPRTVPITEQHNPTNAIMTINQRILTVCVTATPQQCLGWSSESVPT